MDLKEKLSLYFLSFILFCIFLIWFEWYLEIRKVSYSTPLNDQLIVESSKLIY